MLKTAFTTCIVILWALCACTRENKEFCCTSPNDCQAAGLNDTQRACAAGLACVDHSCIVPSCATTGCGPAASVCDLGSSQCVGCTGPADCTRFATSPMCDPGGGCVQCLRDIDCGIELPVCEGSTCRKCVQDAECASGACDENGSCVAEAQAVYLAPSGIDALPCSRSQPCKELRFALMQTSSTRAHVVMMSGTYTLANPLNVDSQITSATHVFIHGGGSRVEGGGSDGLLVIQLPTSITDLEIVDPYMFDAAPLFVTSSAVLSNVRLRGYDGIRVTGQVNATKLTIHAIHFGISSGGVVTLDGGLIEGGTVGISASSGNLSLTNLLLQGTSGLGIDVSDTSGSLSFSTITNTGSAVSGTAGVRCVSAGVTFRSSIVWTRTTTARPTVEGSCNFISSIVGPTGVAGAANSDPLFVNPAIGDYHLSGGSPARDLVDVGPPKDFEGDSRPRGVRFDVGADEAP